MVRVCARSARLAMRARGTSSRYRLNLRWSAYPKNVSINSSGSACAYLTILPVALSVENYIDPGAGLSQLPDWFQDSDFMFDGLFTTPYFPDISDTDNESVAQISQPEKPIPMVRAYTSDSTM